MSTRPPRQGEVWDVDFDPIRGHERGGFRPALVVSTNRFNRNASELCVVVPITRTDKGFAFHPPIDPPEGGVTSHSVILSNQIRTVSWDRLQRYRGNIESTTLARVVMLIGKIVGI